MYQQTNRKLGRSGEEKRNKKLVQKANGSQEENTEVEGTARAKSEAVMFGDTQVRGSSYCCH